MSSSTGAIGRINESVGSTLARTSASAPMPEAVNGMSRSRKARMEMIANAPIPQLRKSSDSNMLEAGIRPAICQRSDNP